MRAMASRGYAGELSSFCSYWWWRRASQRRAVRQPVRQRGGRLEDAVSLIQCPQGEREEQWIV